MSTFRKLKMEELGRLSVEQYKKEPKIPVVVVLDNVRSGLNVGSVFRTADAFRVKKIYLCGITAFPPNKEINKTALGATESVDWEYFKDSKEAVLKLKHEGYKIISVEQAENSVKLQEFKVFADFKYAFIFGNEVSGVQQEIIDLSEVAIEIPQYGTKHSLNISVSAGIVLWEIVKKGRYLF